MTTVKTPLTALLITVIILAAIGDGILKLVALWKSARHDQLVAHATGLFRKTRHLQKNRHGTLFLCLAIFNTAGILTICYILFFQKSETTALAPKN